MLSLLTPAGLFQVLLMVEGSIKVGGAAQGQSTNGVDTVKWSSWVTA